MTITAIVPAAGCGARAALNGNKILAPLRERAVLSWTLAALERGLDTLDDLQTLRPIIAARPEEFEAIRRALGEQTDYELVAGGANRQDSVFNAVASATSDFVLVHDAARPCVSSAIVARVVRRALETGAAIAALPVSDTVKQADAEGNIALTLNREHIWLAQTPQVFKRAPFLEALQKARKVGFVGTDCASILEHTGRNVALVEGEVANLKITYASDMERAAAILKAQNFF